MTAVLQARKEYYALKQEFRASRENNMEKISLQVVPEQIKKSILVLYFLRGVKCFSQLNKFLPKIN
jgi:hypothetical protein